MVNVEQLKAAVNGMLPERVAEAICALREEGLVSENRTPFGRLQFNTCFAEVEALFQRAGFHRPLDVVGYQGLAYALYDSSRWEAVDVLRWLRKQCQEAQTASVG